MPRPNLFEAALKAHDPVRLRQAFAMCAERVERAPHRTTLNRWLDGTVPQRGDFVKALGEELDDPRVYEAWVAARGGRAASPVEAAVNQFESLTAEEKREAFAEIRNDFVSQSPSTREGLAYRVEVNDPPGEGDNHLQMRVSISWQGQIPAHATVQLVTDQESLGEAYEASDCIFREVLAFDTSELERLLGSTRPPVLAINPLGSGAPRGVHHVGNIETAGLYRFDNAAAGLAQVQVTVTYPYPIGSPVFFVKFGRYQVPDTARVELILNSATATNPRAFPYLPPGVQREFATSPVPPDELFVSLGTGPTALSEGDGVVLYWTETRRDG